MGYFMRWYAGWYIGGALLVLTLLGTVGYFTVPRFRAYVDSMLRRDQRPLSDEDPVYAMARARQQAIDKGLEDVRQCSSGIRTRCGQGKGAAGNKHAPLGNTVKLLETSCADVRKELDALIQKLDDLEMALRYAPDSYRSAAELLRRKASDSTVDSVKGGRERMAEDLERMADTMPARQQAVLSSLEKLRIIRKQFIEIGDYLKDLKTSVELTSRSGEPGNPELFVPFVRQLGELEAFLATESWRK